MAYLLIKKMIQKQLNKDLIWKTMSCLKSPRDPTQKITIFLFSMGIFLHCSQWRSHWGSRGAECHPWQRKIAKNREKEGKIRKKEEKSGNFFTLPLLTDRAGYATDCSLLYGPERTGTGESSAISKNVTAIFTILFLISYVYYLGQFV